MTKDGLEKELLVTDKEGIQPDYSFHQHGHFIYNGSYGSNFLRESIWMATTQTKYCRPISDWLKFTISLPT